MNCWKHLFIYFYVLTRYQRRVISGGIGLQKCSIHLFNFICSRGKQFSLAISFLLLNLSEWRIFQFKTFKQNQKLIVEFLKIFSIISKPLNFSVKSLFTIFQLLYTFIKSPKIPAEEILFHSIHFKVSKNFVDLSNIIFQFTTFSTRKFL